MPRNHFTGTSAPQTSPFCSVSLYHICVLQQQQHSSHSSSTTGAGIPHKNLDSPTFGVSVSESKQFTPFAVVPYSSLHCSLFFYYVALCFPCVWVLVFPCPSSVNPLVPLCPCAHGRRSLCLSLHGTWTNSKGSMSALMNLSKNQSLGS